MRTKACALLVAGLVGLSTISAVSPATAKGKDKDRSGQQIVKSRNGGIDTQLSKKVTRKPQKTNKGADRTAKTTTKTEQPIVLYVRGGCRDDVRNAVGGAATACRATQPDADNEEEVDEQVDAFALAQQVASRLSLVTPTLKTSPEAPTKALVGLETWLWVPDGQWRPLTDSAELGGTQVTVTARPIQTRWNMGESVKACANPGRAWRKGLGKNAKTICGYTYNRTSARQPGNEYQVSAVIRYAVTWTCQGACTQGGGNLGTLDSPADVANLQVGERHAVIVN